MHSFPELQKIKESEAVYCFWEQILIFMPWVGNVDLISSLLIQVGKFGPVWGTSKYEVSQQIFERCSWSYHKISAEFYIHNNLSRSLDQDSHHSNHLVLVLCSVLPIQKNFQWSNFKWPISSLVWWWWNWLEMIASQNTLYRAKGIDRIAGVHPGIYAGWVDWREATKAWASAGSPF
jgi:hypothetical protein